MATPQIPGGQCPHCAGPIIDLFAEWTEEYQTAAGKRDILVGDVVFDCYFCEGPFQLVLPLAIVLPMQPANAYRVAKRSKGRCEAWLRAQHPGASLSEVVEMAGWQFGPRWAFDGYNWREGDVHHHRQDTAPTP